LQVLHTPPYTHASFIARLIGILTLAGPQTALGIAREEKLTISMTMEMIRVAESEAHVCRDDGSSMITGGSSGVGVDVRWWKNVFKDYVWDGQD
jgi:ESCRT-II complex subunit VPS36